jgi:hypothetical protein
MRRVLPRSLILVLSCHFVKFAQMLTQFISVNVVALRAQSAGFFVQDVRCRCSIRMQSSQWYALEATF